MGVSRRVHRHRRSRCRRRPVRPVGRARSHRTITAGAPRRTPGLIGPTWSMPIPAAPVGRSGAAATVLRLFEQLHDQIREELAGLDDAALNWSPGPDGNSIANIVTHVVGSEAETLRCVANVPCTRDREAEFVPDAKNVAE